MKGGTEIGEDTGPRWLVDDCRYDVCNKNKVD